MSWQPIHPNHAIERTRIAVQFRDQLPQKTVVKLGEGFEAQRAEFGFGPRVEIQSQTLVVSQDGSTPPMQTQQSRGWQYVRGVQPGAVLEALVLDADGLVYENVEYTRWADFWKRAASMIVPIIRAAEQVSHIRLYSLEYFDRFYFLGEPTSAEPSRLITSDVIRLMPDSVIGGGELWHVHHGWYESAFGIRVLVNQNIDANDGVNSNGNPVRGVGIYTKVERRNREEVVDASQIEEDLAKMHAISKRVFGQALLPSVRAMIGLQDAASD